MNWGDFNVIIKPTRSPYHEAMELLPRVILAALAAGPTIEFVRRPAIAAGSRRGKVTGYHPRE